MPHVVLIEPEGLLRSLVRPHLGAMGEGLHVVGTLEEAQALPRFREGLLVLARGRSDARYAAELACAFDLHAADEPVRLVVLETGAAAFPEGNVAWTYLHEIDRTLACTHFTPGGAEGVDPRLGLAEDFPHDTYRPLARVGELACGAVYLVRNRVSGFKELLVQTCDDQIASGAVAQALYRNFRSRARPWIDMLRHEVTRHHSFISSSSLPFDLARQVDLAAA
ncbi:MAG TPA: hypothetical protein VFE23_10255 [Usitatibacter sp.]|jgi:hypothetical protein|nr:hypothetical protein [Usitatibacter sp.]